MSKYVYEDNHDDKVSSLIDKATKIREQELKKDYEKRFEEEEMFYSDMQEIADTKILKTEKVKAKERADEIIKYYAYDKWKILFNKVSFLNEIPCQVLFHVVLGQLLSKKKIYESKNSFLDFRNHFIWIQCSGSGKGKAFEFVNNITRKLKNYDGNEIEFYASGIDTTAALIDSFIPNRNGRGYTAEVRAGILSSNDFICWEEAASLFKPMGEHNEGKVRAILDATEPYGSPKNIHTKALVSWPEPTHTISSASFIATSRPISNLRGEVLYSGLFQRFLTYIRKVTFEERKIMMEKACLTSFIDDEETGKNTLLEKDLIKELKDLQAFGKKVDLKPHPRDKVLKFINDKISYLLTNCWVEIVNSSDRSIIESFVARARDSLVKLACHSAIMRKSKYVEMCDIEYAFTLVKLLHDNLKVWVEIDTEKEHSRLLDRRMYIIEHIVKDEKKIKRSDLIKKIKKRCKLGETSAYHLLNRALEINGPIKLEDGYIVSNFYS